MNAILEALRSFGNLVYSGFREMASYVPDFPLYIALLFFCYGIYIVFLQGATSQYIDIVKAFAKTPRDEDAYFKRLGLKINANTYILGLYTVGLALFLAFGVYAAATVNIGGFFAALFVAGVLVIALQPQKEIIPGITSPFMMVVNFLTKRKSAELDRELYNSITTLKNLAIAQEESAISADLMLEKLMENSKKLKPVYAQMLVIYRSGDQTSALRYFRDAIGTKNAATFALTLEKLDRINPTELKTQVISLQEIMAEERFTKGLARAENRGNIIYLLATTVCFICLINFMFVCVFMDSMDMLNGIF